MQKMLTGLTLAAIAAASLSTAALARPGADGPRHHPMRIDFAELDADGDGRITEEEANARRAAQVGTLDANGDGLISADELAAAEIARLTERANERAARQVERMDVDGDGLLSAAELAVPAGHESRMFEKLDRDGDGAITQPELDAAHRPGPRD